MQTLIRNLREERRNTVRSVAVACDVAESALSAIELRKRFAWPALRRRIAEYYGRDEAQLFTEEGLAAHAMEAVR